MKINYSVLLECAYPHHVPSLVANSLKQHTLISSALRFCTESICSQYSFLRPQWIDHVLVKKKTTIICDSAGREVD